MKQNYAKATPEQLKGRKMAYKRRIKEHEARLQKVEDTRVWNKSGPERAKVPGGWLVRQFSQSGNENGGGGITFVPDPDYKWE